MPLVVPILRLYMLFLNIWDTYKVLKHPPPSSRNGGRPSVRAVTQRKRDMKGCLAVWIVWCCYATYERTIDSFVRIFIPLYDEAKCIIMLFLILTRAKGAEPIYLHVLRPLIKPYSSVLDFVLDLATVFGDLILSTLLYPLHGLFSFFKWGDHSMTFNKELNGEYDDSPVGSSVKSLSMPEEIKFKPALLSLTRKSSLGGHKRFASAPVTTSQNAKRPPIGLASRKSSADAASSRVNPRPFGRRVPSAPGMSRSKSNNSTSSTSTAGSNTNADAGSKPAVYESSNPPLDVDRESEISPTVVDTPTVSRTSGPDESDEWRRYPDFPSAYPPTPMPATSASLHPQGVLSPRTMGHLRFLASEEGEEWRRYEGFPSAYPATPVQVPRTLLGPISGRAGRLGVVDDVGEEVEADEEREVVISGNPLSVEENVGDSASSAEEEEEDAQGGNRTSTVLADNELSVSGGSSTDSESEVNDEDNSEADASAIENSFDVTLRTPPFRPPVALVSSHANSYLRSNGATLRANRKKAEVLSVASVLSQATALSTDGASDFRTDSEEQERANGGGQNEESEEEAMGWERERGKEQTRGIQQMFETNGGSSANKMSESDEEGERVLPGKAEEPRTIGTRSRTWNLGASVNAKTSTTVTGTTRRSGVTSRPPIAGMRRNTQSSANTQINQSSRQGSGDVSSGFGSRPGSSRSTITTSAHAPVSAFVPPPPLVTRRSSTREAVGKKGEEEHRPYRPGHARAGSSRGSEDLNATIKGRPRVVTRK